MEITTYLTTQSKIKLDATNSFIDFFNKEKNILLLNSIPINSKTDELVEQPVDSAIDCAKIRLKKCEEIIHNSQGLYISIENGLVTTKNPIEDICFVLVKYKNKIYEGKSFGIKIPQNFYEILQTFPKKDKGYQITLGEIINKKNPEIPKDNWMREKQFGEIDRNVQIQNALKNVFEQIFN